MNLSRRLVYAGLLVISVFWTGCGTSVVLQNVDFSQPVESVLTPDSNGEIHDQRFALRLNVTPLLEVEGLRDVNEIRLIRNRDGFYFLTADGFSSVYVLKPGEGELVVHEQIELEEPLELPAFNQRGTHIELIGQNFTQTYYLDQNGVQE